MPPLVLPGRAIIVVDKEIPLLTYMHVCWQVNELKQFKVRLSLHTEHLRHIGHALFIYPRVAVPVYA